MNSGSVRKLWTGQFPLPVAFWGFGLAGWCGLYLALSFVVSVLRAGTTGNYLFATAWMVLLAYMALVCVGIWRSANNFKGARAATIGAKIAVAICVLYWTVNLTAKGFGSRLLTDFFSSN